MYVGKLSDKATAALVKVAEWLENGAQHVTIDANGREIDSFDMEYGVNEKDGCGTACCIAGAVYQFEGLHGNYGPGDFFCEVSPQAKKFLKGDDLTEEEQEALDALFLPWDFFDYTDTEEFSDPKRAAKVIRHLLATGIVDWDIDVKENA